MSTDAGALLKLADEVRDYIDAVPTSPVLAALLKRVEPVVRQAASQGKAGGEPALRAALQEIDEIGRKITDLKNERGIRMGNIAHAALLGAGTAAQASQGLKDIATERHRQINEEGWTEDHDDAHSDREMAIAAACYATAPPMVRIEREWTPPDCPKNWPWHGTWWKPGFQRRNLVKAGALIVAEIDRIDRASSVPSASRGTEA